METRIVVAEVGKLVFASVYIPNGGKDFDAKMVFLRELEAWSGALEAAGKKELVPELQSIADQLLKDPARFVDIMREKRPFLQTHYVSCMQEVENEGHRFGEDLSDADKKALTAFLATL